MSKKILGNNPAVPWTTTSKDARGARAAQVREPFAYVNAEGVYREAQLLVVPSLYRTTIRHPALILLADYDSQRFCLADPWGHPI